MAHDRLTIICNARILTIRGEREPRRGRALRDPGIIESGHVIVRDGLIETLAEGDPPSIQHASVIDARRRVLMPGFVDCHTHACWVGERFDEFDMKLTGASYLDILKSGGGIMATVRAVRRASLQELIELLVHRVGRMMTLGSTTIEVKSGYGLNTQAELKMLHAIEEASGLVDAHLVPTFLGAHAIDPHNPRCIDETIEETLPAAAQAFPGIACDAYCEDGAWSLDQTTRLFERAIELGCPLRVHADQFNALGMTRRAIEMGALSVDHLEASTDDELAVLAESGTIGVALPICGFQVDDRYAPGRKIVDLGGALAIASNYNPGSAPSPSMPFAIALAVRKLGLTPAEAIVCCTHNAACVLGLADTRGSIQPGMRADLQLLDCTDERELACEFATPGPLWVMRGGTIIPGNRRTNLAAERQG